MKQRTAAIALGVLALAGLGAVAHHTSTARASQAATPAPAIPGSSSHIDPLSPATVPATPVPAAGAGVFAGPDATQSTPLGASTATTDPAATAAAPVRERVVYRDRVVYKTRPASQRKARYVVKKRSGKKSAAIIGGSAAGGAAIGAIAGGKKGALIGGLVGGAAGTVYDRKTRKKVVRQ